MLGELNGGPKTLPSIKIGFDETHQAVTLEFAPAEFKSWDFVIACLDMAKSQAEHNRNVGRMQALQAAAQQAQQEQSLRNHLKLR